MRAASLVSALVLMMGVGLACSNEKPAAPPPAPAAPLLAYDKGKLPLHKEVFAAIKKYRAAYDHAKTKEDVEKIRVKQQKALEATGKKMATIDPKGGNSNVVTDYDIMLNAIANDYPDALELSFAGDKKPLEEQTAELDKRSKKIEDWLAQLKAAMK